MKLTDERISELYYASAFNSKAYDGGASDFARAIEAEVLGLNGGGGETVKRGFALVPLKLTREMQEYLGEEDWEWPELLAIAGAVSEEEYDRSVELAAPQPQQAEPGAVLEGQYLIRYNSDGEFGQATGWLYRDGGDPCVVTGKPVYVWRPLKDLVSRVNDREFWLSVCEGLDAPKPKDQP